MRNVGLNNSNYCMTVVGVALPLRVTCKNVYVGNVFVLNWYSLYYGSESSQGLFVDILACETIV